MIASLAVTFGTNVLFSQVEKAAPLGAPIPVPEAASLRPFALTLAVAAFVAIRRYRVNPALVAVACGVAGLVRALIP